jgi:hypothetical protein
MDWLNFDYFCKAYHFIPNQKFHFLLDQKQRDSRVFNRGYELGTLKRCRCQHRRR